MRSPSSVQAQLTRILLLKTANKTKIAETAKKKSNGDRKEGT